MAIKVNNTTVINDSRSILNSTGIEVSGIVTASPGAAITYYGDGSNLTGVSVSAEFNNITTGIITASAYDGFVVADTQTISDNFEFNNNKPNLTFAQDLVISPGVAFTVSAGTTVTVNPFRDIEPGTFEIPSGTTEERQGTPSTGAIRYNTELNYLEFYNGTEWRQIEVSNISSGKAISGYTNLQGTPGNVTNIVPIESFNIKTGGESQYFGFLTRYANNYTSCSSSTRGLFGGGNLTAPAPSSATLSKIDYVTIASDGNSNNFGDLTIARQDLAACSNETRGIFGKGSGPGSLSDMDYVTIATTGDAIDFGNLATAASELSACSNPVKGIFAGGASPANKNEIEFTIINSGGTGYDFGDLTNARGQLGAVSSNVRGVFSDGSGPGSFMDYITIASEGNAIDFGDPDTERFNAGATSDSIRGIFMGGTQPSPSVALNNVEFITIATLGDGIVYGSLPGTETANIINQERTAMSNGHGGLG